MKDSQIQFNIHAHDKVAARYEQIHGEIYNPIEQRRLKSSLARALAEIKTGSVIKRALDVGCGSGNLTDHMLGLGMSVVSSDVSTAFLALIETKFGPTGRSETLILNGTDLTGVPDASFDMAATYSVLHHIPDYLATVGEMARVVRPGGVVYLDHEVNELFWNKTREYVEFIRLVRSSSGWKKYLVPAAYYTKFRLMLNSRFRPEGDIHQFPDDHIEWDKVDQVLAENGCETVWREDYLLYQRNCPMPIFDAFKDRCTDMRLLMARKRVA